MTTSNRRSLLKTAAALAISASVAFGAAIGTAWAQDRESVKIGYAVSKTGANAAGAGTSTIPNYELWVHEVNEEGGLLLPDGTRLPIEVVAYDDRSSTEEVVRAVERLATQDKVDFILPPWGTGFNLAVAPLMDRLNYPQLAVTAITDKAPDFADRWIRSFWFLGGGSDYAEALVEVMTAARDLGEINSKVAMISVADGFGIDLVVAAEPELKAAGFELVYNKTYPLGTSDFASLINDVKATDADSFIAFSYPPGTIAITKQAQVVSYNPDVFAVGVGAGFPVYNKLFGDNVEGVISLGGMDVNSEKVANYFERHEEVTGQKPDTWASSVTYASLQVLEQAIERVGLDRNKVAQEIATGSFDTILGEVKLENNQFRDLWWIGQWQDGGFAALAPTDREGAVNPVIPKPAWSE